MKFDVNTVATAIITIASLFIFPLFGKWLNSAKKVNVAQKIIIIVDSVVAMVKANNPNLSVLQIVDKCIAAVQEALPTIDPAIIKREVYRSLGVGK